MDLFERILFTIIFGGAAVAAVLIVVFIALKVAAQ
jgi:hypothetical protein